MWQTNLVHHFYVPGISGTHKWYTRSAYYDGIVSVPIIPIAKWEVVVVPCERKAWGKQIWGTSFLCPRNIWDTKMMYQVFLWWDRKRTIPIKIPIEKREVVRYYYRASAKRMENKSGTSFLCPRKIWDTKMMYQVYPYDNIVCTRFVPKTGALGYMTILILGHKNDVPEISMHSYIQCLFLDTTHDAQLRIRSFDTNLWRFVSDARGHI